MSTASELLGDAAKAAVDALAITPSGGSAITSVKRKTPSVPEGSSSLPAIVVSVDEEETLERLSSTYKMRTFRFAVTIVTAGGQKAADDAVIRTWRDQIDAAIYDKQGANFGTVPGFVHLRALGGRAFDPAALSKDYNYSVLRYEAKIAEALST